MKKLFFVFFVLWPTWAGAQIVQQFNPTVSSGGIVGVVGTANGGTNQTTWTTGSVPYLSSATQFAQDNANFFWDGANHRLGIGNAAPTLPLTVGGPKLPTGQTLLSGMFWTDTAAGNNLAIGKSFTGVNSPGLAFMKSRGTQASPSVITTGDGLGSVVAYGFDGTNYVTGASISFGSEGTIATGQVPGTLALNTANAAGAITAAITFNSSQRATFGGPITNNNLPTSAGAGGIFVCVDSAGVFYKKATCP